MGLTFVNMGGASHEAIHEKGVHKMIQTQTNEATEMINNQSDTNMSGTGIGYSAPNINLDEIKSEPHKPQTETDPFNPFNIGGIKDIFNKFTDLFKKNDNAKTEEKETTQGEYETKLYELNKQQDNLQEALNFLDNFNPEHIDQWNELQNLINKFSNENFKNLSNEKLKDLSNEERKKEIINVFKEHLLNELSNTKNEIYNIKNKSDYDNRTDEQIRQDTKDSTAYQTVVDDMRKAGINPAAISGVGYAGGGGGGGSSKSDEEEEKRKRKKRELLLAQQQEELRRRQETMQILGMLTGMGGLMGSSLLRNIGYANFWSNQQQIKNNLKSNNTSTNKPWVDEYLQELIEEEKKYK